MTQELIAKLESASEGSDGLSAEVWCALTGDGLTDRSWSRVVTKNGRDGFCESVTTSIDAALALAERVLPHERVVYGPKITIRLSQRFNGTWEASFYRVADGNKNEAVASTPALAICAALLRASAAEGAGG